MESTYGQGACFWFTAQLGLGEAIQRPALADCTRLADLLREDDAESIELLQEHATLLQQALHGTYAEIETAAAQYDFETALERLEQAR